VSNARKAILARLRAGSASEAGIEPASIELVAPQWSEREKQRRFIDRMEAVKAEVIIVDEMAFAEQLEEYLLQKEIDSLLFDPDSPWGRTIIDTAREADRFPLLQPFEKDIEAWKSTLFHHVDAAITTTLGGIAETGSLILWPTASEPRSMSLVPPVHIAILEADQLFATFADAMAQQQWATRMPTNALLISGPSKSADIERTLAYGVHGPRELVVFLISRGEQQQSPEEQ